jgi:hypothetical protein
MFITLISINLIVFLTVKYQRFYPAKINCIIDIFLYEIDILFYKNGIF